MAVFPIWGAISANIINSQNKKQELVGDYVKERANTKDKVIGFGIMIGSAVFIWIVFVVWMWLSN